MSANNQLALIPVYNDDPCEKNLKYFMEHIVYMRAEPRGFTDNEYKAAFVKAYKQMVAKNQEYSRQHEEHYGSLQAYYFQSYAIIMNIFVMACLKDGHVWLYRL